MRCSLETGIPQKKKKVNAMRVGLQEKKMLQGKGFKQ
jgi:hypothetical protein